jgi:hypothetical protein
MNKIKNLISLPEKWYFVRFVIFLSAGLFILFFISNNIGKTIIILSVIQIISVLLINIFKIISIFLFDE